MTMTSRDFCYWLQCSFELMKAKSFDEEQTEIIKNHLAMVFVHEIDPSMGDKEHQGKLNEIHNGSQVHLGPNTVTLPYLSQDTGQKPSNLIARC